jgi:hypothetical protein
MIDGCNEDTLSTSQLSWIFWQIEEDEVEVKVKVQKQKISNVQLNSLQVRAQTLGSHAVSYASVLICPEDRKPRVSKSLDWNSNIGKCIKRPLDVFGHILDKCANSNMV